MLGNLSKFSIALTISAAISAVILPLQVALLVNSNDNAIKQYVETTGEYIWDFVAGSDGLLSPFYLTTTNIPVPEFFSILGVLALGSLFVGGALQRKASYEKLSA